MDELQTVIRKIRDDDVEGFYTVTEARKDRYLRNVKKCLKNEKKSKPVLTMRRKTR